MHESSGATRIVHGHPWIYDNEIPKVSENLQGASREVHGKSAHGAVVRLKTICTFAQGIEHPISLGYAEFPYLKGFLVKRSL